jgi:hypothetical protein
MKKLILAAMLLPSLSFACGGVKSPEGYQGDKGALREIDRKPLVCEYNGVSSEALVESWAIYRCIGSPVRVELTGFEDKLNVSNVTKSGAKFLLTTDRADNAISCVLK